MNWESDLTSWCDKSDTASLPPLHAGGICEWIKALMFLQVLLSQPHHIDVSLPHLQDVQFSLRKLYKYTLLLNFGTVQLCDVLGQLCCWVNGKFSSCRIMNMFFLFTSSLILFALHAAPFWASGLVTEQLVKKWGCQYVSVLRNMMGMMGYDSLLGCLCRGDRVVLKLSLSPFLLQGQRESRYRSEWEKSLWVYIKNTKYPLQQFEKVDAIQ